MTKTPKYSTPPAHEMNQWVRDALSHWGRSMAELAAELTRVSGRNYDRSMVQKMTVKRKVTKAEAEAIAKVTGYSASPSRAGDDILDKFMRLSEDQQDAVERLVDTMLNERKASDR